MARPHLRCCWLRLRVSCCVVVAAGRTRLTDAVFVSGHRPPYPQGNDGASNDAAQRDNVNTVESVEVQASDATLVAIQVSASTLLPMSGAAGTQPYALVVQGRFQGDLNSSANPAAPALDVVSCGALSF